MKRTVTLLIAILFTTLTGSAQIVINEYSCSNVNGPVDAFGNREDWFELYNSSGTAFDITGFFLSDKATNLSKFEIPSGNIPANGFLRIYCSGQNTVSGGEIHTNFKLTQTRNEKIIFSDNAGNVIDSLTINFLTQADHSYGRSTDGDANWSLYTSPTPGATNTGGINYYTATPVFDVAPGFYAGAQTVTLSSGDASATIYYTLDGSEPTTASNQYSTPLNIGTTTVVRARAYSSDPNTPASFIETNTYFIGVTHPMPVLSIADADVQVLLDGNNGIEPTGSFEFFEADGTFIDEAVGLFNKHGNDSWAYGQRGFDFKARDQFGYNNAIHHQIFPAKTRDEFQKLIVKAAANDNYSFENGAHLRDAYVHTISAIGDLRVDERTSAFCVLYLNGVYWGVYDIREKVDDHDFTSYYYDQDEHNVDFLKTWGGTWAEYGNRNDWDDLVAYIMANDVTDPTVYQTIKSRYNVGSLIDYVVLNSHIVSADWLNWNTAWWRGKNPDGDKKKYRYVLWDMDASFDHYINYTGVPDQSANADPCNPESLAGGSDPEGHIAILNKLNQNETFRQEYIARYIDLNNDILSCESMQHILDSMVAVIDPEMQAQVNKWGGSYAGWQSRVQQMKDFIDQRCVAITNGLMDCYDLTGPFQISVDVQPPGSGNVKVNSLELSNYVWSGEYFGGIQNLFKAIPEPGFEFDYWEVLNHPILPSATEDTAYIEDLTQDETIVAHFRQVNTPPTDPPLTGLSGVEVPNAFSPNGDGNNDLLQLFVGADVQSFTFRLFDRWGHIVWEASAIGSTFDGTLNGKKLNTGVFAYTIEIEFKDDKPKEFKSGNITLMR